MPYVYRITLKQVSDRRSQPVDGDVCEFQAANHDDILEIVTRTKHHAILPEQDVAAFCVGLKLLAEVVMRHREKPPFAEFWPHLGEFVRGIKATASPERASK
ncbi:hypothetical protein MesoLjLc_76590 [Mesorhizobium sp. L-8-10]|uniref:DUF3861 domain-containing protein n=1 Tax=Mesorhizobium sp. L-8-10 TaxID=2744523 RepID=UPI0019286BA4|nr:DUF3861 domain-containing protein [Mesorhizobium sp. L-8-10]BCH35729.1 hypothetical protein MesoLjLc_76590 [Mesorhizobium sp. L-8-10]